MARRDGMAWTLRAAAVRYRFAESLFLLPSIVMASGILLAVGATSLDATLGHDADLPFLLTMTNNAALWLLATVAGAMITTVGVVFSLTVVSLQLASNQFSPRVMRSFIRDRLSQGVIGLLVGTFFYCVLVLPRLSGDEADPAPRVSLTIAVALTLITVIGIIIHLDHLARSLQVGNVARAIAVEGEQVVASASRAPRGLERVEIKEHPIADDAIVVPCQSSGWVSQVSVPGLLRAVPPGTTLRLETRVGAYIHAGEPLLRVWPPVPERAQRALAAAVEIADTRTMLQDVDFAIRQLVDIGLRALSPAIHDPTTAIEVILRLGTVLRAVLVAPLPPTGLRDRSGRVLLSPWNLEHEEYVAHAFDQLRQSSLKEPDVATALLRVLRMLRAHVQDAGQSAAVPALERQMRLLIESLRETGLHPEDLRRIEAMRSDDTDPADHSL